MLNTVTILLDRNIGMSYIAIGSTIKVVNLSSEFTAKNYLTVLLSAIESIEFGSMLSIGNNMIYNGLTIYMNKWIRENYSTIQGTEAKRLWKRIHGLININDIAVTKLRGDKSNIEDRLQIICNKGIFITKEFKNLEELDKWLGIEYASNREHKRKANNIRATTPIRKVQTRRTRENPIEDIGLRSGGRIRNDGNKNQTRNKSNNEIRTKKIGNQYLHIVAGNKIRYKISDYEDCPYESVGTRGRKIPDNNFKRIYARALNGKLLVEHEYKESYDFEKETHS